MNQVPHERPRAHSRGARMMMMMMMETKEKKYHSSVQHKWPERKNFQVTLKRWSEREEKKDEINLTDYWTPRESKITVENE